MTDQKKFSPKKEKTEEPSVVQPGREMPGGGQAAMPVQQGVSPQAAGHPTQTTTQPVGQQPTSVLTPQQPQPPTQPLKKRFPKIPILIIALVALVSIFVFILIKVKPGGLTSVGKKGEIVWWGFWEESIVAPLISEYQEENPNIEITYVTQSTKDYRERLTNALARNDGPDMFRFHNSWVSMFESELDTLPATAMSSAEFTQIFYPVFSSDLTTREGIVGIPLGYDAITLFINEDIFAAAGKAPPSTWDDFQKTARELTTKADDAIIQSGAAIGRTENVDHWQEILGLMMLQNGVNMTSPKGQLAEDAVNFYTVFYTEDTIWDETLPPSTVAFANGKVAMYFGPSWRANEINSMNPNLRYKTVPLPQLRKDDPQEPDVSYATYWVEGVWKKSANRELAWDFLTFLAERDSLESLHENLGSTRFVAESYPRSDMGNVLNEHKIMGSVIALAPQAKSWLIADETFDGPTGINSQLGAIFKEVIDNVVSGREAERELNTAAPEVAKILSRYGIK